MGLFDNIKSVMSKEFFGFVSDNSISPDSSGAEGAIYPNWLFSSRLGQPLNKSIPELRIFAKSAWIQMIENTLRKEIMTIPTDLVNIDESDENDYSDLKNEIDAFLNNINDNGEQIIDLCIDSVSDLSALDGGVWNNVFSLDSYEMQSVEVVDAYGKPTREYAQKMVLKPFGKRRLKAVKSVDGGSFLKAVDVFKNTKGYYQYSFKHPHAQPIYFEPAEINYLMMNRRANDVYGFSPLESIQQVVQMMIDSIRWNKDFFRNNMIPDGIISLPGVDSESLKRFEKLVKRKVRGKAHQLLFQNTEASFTSFMSSPRDLEFLEGQKWYFHLVFAVYGMSPVEVGFHENVNRSTQEGQERVTVKNAIKPYLTLFERAVNNVIKEYLQDDNVPVKWVFRPKDHGAEQEEHKQRMDQIDRDLITINEYRKFLGMDSVSYGDEPIKQQVQQPNNAPSQVSEEQKNSPSNNQDKYFKKSFERFMNELGD